MNRHVIDTNVLIVASGEHSESPFSSTNHPVENPDCAAEVFGWLSGFEQAEDRMVLDDSYQIYNEYNKKMTDQDYGLLVMVNKMDKGLVDYVTLDWENDPSNPEPVAVLKDDLRAVIHDLSDRKIVAACINANNEYGKSTIVNACDTDWIDWEDILVQEKIIVEHIIEEWLRAKWKEKFK